MSDLYEIINPSDAYTIRGEREVVFAAVVLLGEGAYGARGASVDSHLPVLAFHADALGWWLREFGRDLDESLRALKQDIAAALETVLIGSPSDRDRMERVFASISSEQDRAKARAAWHDSRRSSMNDIGAQAAAVAAKLRATHSAPTGGSRG